MSERLTDAAIREAAARAEKATPRCPVSGSSRSLCDCPSCATWPASFRDEVPALAAEALARGEERDAALAEVARLRAAAIPPDAEERIAKALWNGRMDEKRDKTWDEMVAYAPPAEWPCGTPAVMLTEARVVLAALRGGA